ncbi:PilZ domain-containing protein [Ornithinibacillus sp. FSL M8-0202]|uniref:flagellar brake protein n=1 Tax=unclassified Ornithinibacillus TaxID=2620869 RepID=UPI0030CB6A64
MKIGVFLTIEAFSIKTNSTEKYRCKIVDKNSNYLYVDYPVHIQTKRTNAGFKIGDIMYAEYNGEDQSVYRFKTEVIDKQRGKIPTLALVIPEKDQIERIQRRQYVRVEAATDVAVHSMEKNFPPFTTVTVDISGGGLSVIIPKGTSIMEQEKVTLYLVLHMHSGEYSYLELSGEVVRIIHQEHTANIASIKLHALSEQDKQSIVRYCFEKQREARQKEIQ